ncbi:MAG: hypothetical protein RI897_3224 [Verrucomicrobiota bacterium]
MGEGVFRGGVGNERGVWGDAVTAGDFGVESIGEGGGVEEGGKQEGYKEAGRSHLGVG